MNTLSEIGHISRKYFGYTTRQAIFHFFRKAIFQTICFFYYAGLPKTWFFLNLKNACRRLWHCGTVICYYSILQFVICIRDIQLILYELYVHYILNWISLSQFILKYLKKLESSKQMMKPYKPVLWTGV